MHFMSLYEIHYIIVVIIIFPYYTLSLKRLEPIIQLLYKNGVILKIMLSLSRAQLIENKDVFISCVVPVYNEEATIISFITQLSACLAEMTKTFEIIVVDDGSKDSTLEKIRPLAQNNTIKLISFSPPYHPAG